MEPNKIKGFNAEGEETLLDPIGAASVNVRVDDLDARIAARPGPKVTPDRVRDAIAAEQTITFGLLTIVVLTLRNGFLVTGESACASPETYDPKIGYDLARRAAESKVWMLEGYLLKEQLFNERMSVDLNRNLT